MSRPLLRVPLRPLPRPTNSLGLQHSPGFPRPRYASTQSAPRRFLSTTLLLGTGVALVAYYYDSRSILHEHVIMPIMRLVDPETGHKLAVRMLSGSSWLRPHDRGVDNEKLQAELFGMKLSNPVGIAAGFDKDAEAIDGLFDLGFGYVEVGSVTPEPQPGNPQPRFFRLGEDSAAINRYGFNSLGHGQTLARLRARILHLVQTRPELFPSPVPTTPLPPPSLPRSLRPGHILAVNLGKNKTSAADSNDDYVRGVRTLGPYADVVVINVSSPNTPGLRALQGKQILEKLLNEVVSERDRIAVNGLPKIAVKVACDLSEDELSDVAGAVRSSGVEGVIISNTTIRRHDLGLQSENQMQVGGLSGRPLFPLALHALKTLRPLLPPSIPIMGCGGISTGSDALAMAQAGAAIVQLYTSFGYRGVGTPRLLKDEIMTGLGSSSWKAQVGSGYPDSQMGYIPDEKRLSKTRDALVDEAKGLGDLLRDLKSKEDVTSLMKEAQIALGRMQRDKEADAGKEQAEPPKQAVAKPRDNALGAGGPAAPPTDPGHCETERDYAFAFIEDVLSPHIVRGSSHTPHHHHHHHHDHGRITETSGMTGSGHLAEVLSDVLPTPAVDLEPIVVIEEARMVEDVGVPVPEAQVPSPVEEKEEVDGFAQSVKTGERRLV